MSRAVLVSVGLHLVILGLLLNIIKLPSSRHQQRGDEVFVELHHPEERAPLGHPSARTPGPLGPASQSAPPQPRAAKESARQSARVAEAPSAPAPAPPRPAVQRPAVEPSRTPAPAPSTPAPPTESQIAKAVQPPTQTTAPTAPAAPTPTPAPSPAPSQAAAPSSDSRVAMVPPGNVTPDLRSFHRGGGDGTPGGHGGGRGGITGEPISLENPDPKFAEYLARVKEKIVSNWGFPCVKDSVTKACDYRSAALVIEFGILKDGHLQFVELRQPSGNGLQIYDDYAMNAIKLSSPFPEIPRDIMLTLLARSRGTTGMPIAATFTYSVETSLRNLLR